MYYVVVRFDMESKSYAYDSTIFECISYANIFFSLSPVN